MAEPRSTQAPSASSTYIDLLATQFRNKFLRRSEESRKLEWKARSSVPWKSWELNEKFFRTLSQWTIDNPETSLDRVLDSIRDGLEDSRDLLSLIPDSPFPAGALVAALAYLLKLGVTVPRAQKDVQIFAKAVIHWVGLVKSAFESPGGGRFTRLAWRDLRKMREVIDEICSWAVDRLEDGRWSRIGHGLFIQKEIQDFQKRLDDARVLFRDLAAINLAQGLDAILAIVRELFHHQCTIVDEELSKIRKTQTDQFTQIMNELERRQLVAERARFLKKALAAHTIVDPTYDKQGKCPCDPNTRLEVLAEINDWINNISSGCKNFLWLTGDPGCGKSAITASVAKECKKRNILWAQFFINRNNVETTDPNSYFPTIAYQMAQNSPDVAIALQATLVNDRTLTDAISADQATKLFVDSVRCASRLDTTQPVVVVIDGLDETRRRNLKETADIFSSLFTALKEHSNVKVFISSRTEDEIRSPFSHRLHDKHVKHIHLDTTEPFSIRDVSNYIKGKLSNIVEEYDLNWDVWPGEQRSLALGERASGLFIWGVTAIRFIEAQLQANGEEHLGEVLDLLTADALHDINALYTLILKVTYGTSPSEWTIERFRRILGAILFLQEPLCIDDLATLLDLRMTPSSDAVDICHFVRRLRTILVAGTDVVDGKTVPRIHKSVFEFLTGGVEPQYRIEPGHAHLELGMRCLIQLGAAQQTVMENILPKSFRYASRFWSVHLSQAKLVGQTTLCADYRRSSSPSPPSLLLHSTRLLEIPMRIQYFPTTLSIRTSTGAYEKISDAMAGISHSDHTGNVTCMVFAPTAKEIITCSDDKTIRAWNINCSQLTRMIVSYSSPFFAVAISPDNGYIASGSDDCFVCLWDYSTGVPIGSPLQGHNRRVICLAVSPDGEQIVSGSEDKTCILWNTRSRQCIGKPWTGHKSTVISTSFSGSGQRICSLDDLGHGIVWDVNTGQKISVWHDNKIQSCISYSPANDDILAIGRMDGVRFRSTTRQWSISDIVLVRCLSFLPDGKGIVFATPHTIYVARMGKDEDASHVIKQRDYDASGFRQSYAFSPNADYFAYANDVVRVFALRHDQTDFDIVPVNGPISTAQVDIEDEELLSVLSNTEGAWFIDKAQTNNRHLDAINWYEKGVDNAKLVVDLLVVMDDAIIAAYKDGSVSVWKR